MKKAILYCRVGSDEQAASGLDYQEDALKRFCESNGIKVVEIYREVYSSKTFDRPEMKKICKKFLRRQKDVRVDGLLVLSWDRFSRSISNGLRYILRFRECGIEVNAIDDNTDLYQEEVIQIMMNQNRKTI